MIEISSIGRRRNNRRWQMLIGVFVAVFLFTFLVGRSGIKNEDVEAASLANFDPGYIISDYQMSNYNSMSEAEIQAFLTSKNSCPNRDYNYYQQLSAGSVATWHWENGHFVCLSEERFGDGETIGTGDTAAHIIWQTAQDFKINPKVILVLLQKETSLITDPIPNNYDYRKAVGYGCPDTAACSSTYYGFKNQVRNAAALFRTVLDGGWTNYPLGNNYIQYNPNAACGGSVVNVRSLATSALYRYTPYQPNAGAIAAGYGTAPCGAYGNRNFYLYFQDWFGGVTDEKKASEASPRPNINYNKIESVKTDLAFSYRTNVQELGWMEWEDGGVMVGTTGNALGIKSLEMKLGSGTGIEYMSYIHGSGWESSYKKDGGSSGNADGAVNIDGVKIKLSDALSSQYDIYYRVHVSNIGWMDWVKNDETAGVPERGLQIEALQAKFVKKNTDVSYLAHVQDIGWMSWVKNGATAGTTGRAKQVEAIQIKLDGSAISSSDIQYRAHVQDIGWMGWVKNGETAGTTGRAKQVEAIEIKLSDELAKSYDITYRAHVQDIGWMGWVKNGETAGTTGRAKQVEAIEIKLVHK